MLQPDSSLPTVPLKPAPWDLTGQGWIIAMKLPADSPARDDFMDRSLRGQGRGGYALMMFVDYAKSDAGPYHELLLIPGNFPFADGKRHLSISRILVSTWDSVVNGRRNWGIPKDRCDFEVQYNAGGSGEDHIVLRDNGRVMAELKLKATWPFSLPMLGGLVPEAMRTLAQRYNGQDYFYAPSSGGWIRPGRVVSWRFDNALFPDVSGAKVLAAVKIPDFRMTFPLARTLPSR